MGMTTRDPRGSWPGEGSDSTTILVVDDDEASRTLARHTLEREGYRVIEADGGAEGIAMFDRERPDCVLLDARMPGVDGFAVCERIRTLPGGRGTPLLFLTGLRDVDTFDHALLAGADEVLTKPIRPSDLAVHVRSALKICRLSDEVREHYELLKHERDALQRLRLQKERLMAFVVHDLRNPVNSIDLHAQVLQRDRELPPAARDSITQIRAATRQLGRMILNLLDVSKADEVQLAPKREVVDLRQLVDEVVSDLDIHARDRDVTVHASVETDTLHGDVDILRRALANLVENAIRYAPAMTSVSVRVTLSADAVELRVADSGRGIPPEMRESVFSPFVQVESSDPDVPHGSRGLGLTFCKVAVEAHGGRIWVEDGAPGTVFCMRLPSVATARVQLGPPH